MKSSNPLPDKFIEIKVETDLENKDAIAIQNRSVNIKLRDIPSKTLLPYSEIYTQEYLEEHQLIRHNDFRIVARGDQSPPNIIFERGGIHPSVVNAPKRDFKDDFKSVTVVPDIITKPEDLYRYNKQYIIAHDENGEMNLYSVTKPYHDKTPRVSKTKIDDDYIQKIITIKSSIPMDKDEKSDFDIFINHLKENSKNNFGKIKANYFDLEDQQIGEFERLVSDKGGISNAHNLSIREHRMYSNNPARPAASGNISLTTDINSARRFAITRGTEFVDGYVYLVVVGGLISATLSPKSISDPYPDEKEINAPGGIDAQDIIAFRKVSAKGVFEDSIFINQSFIQKNPELLDQIIPRYLHENEKASNVNQVKFEIPANNNLKVFKDVITPAQPLEEGEENKHQSSSNTKDLNRPGKI